MKEKILNWFKEFFNPNHDNAYDTYIEMHESETQKRIEQDYKTIAQNFKKSLHKKIKANDIGPTIDVQFYLSHTESWYVNRLEEYTQEQLNNKELKEQTYNVKVCVRPSYDNSGHIPDTATLLILVNPPTAQTKERL